jgi:hypothetical protein
MLEVPTALSNRRHHDHAWPPDWLQTSRESRGCDLTPRWRFMSVDLSMLTKPVQCIDDSSIRVYMLSGFRVEQSQ